MKKSNILAVFLALCLISALLPAQNAGAEAITRWKIATVAPKQVGWAVQVRSLVLPWIEKSTDDNLKLKVYWGGAMGNDQEYLKKMDIGQLQGAGITGAGAYIACPEFNILGLPFIFNDYDEADYIRKVMYPTFNYYFEQHGYKLFLWLETGFDQVYSTKRPMTSVGAFRDSRIQTWFGPVEEAGLRALGATPIPLSTMEGIAGYKTGIIDSSIMPVIGCIGTQLHIVVRYVTPWNMRYSPALLLVTKEAWDQLPRQYRDNMEQSRNGIENEFIKSSRAEINAGMAAIVQYGIKLEELSPETLADFKRRTRPVWKQFAGDLYPKELLDELQQHLADFRKGVVREKPAAVLAVKSPAVKPAPKPVEKPAAPAVVAPAPPEAAMETPPTDKKEAEAFVESYAKAYEESIEEEKKAEERLKAEAAAAPPPAPKEKRMSAWEKRRLQVRQVQEKLKPLGYYDSTVDGLYGPITRKGILSYQKDEGLPQSGIIDDRLLKALGIEE